MGVRPVTTGPRAQVTRPEKGRLCTVATLDPGVEAALAQHAALGNTGTAAGSQALWPRLSP